MSLTSSFPQNNSELVKLNTEHNIITTGVQELTFPYGWNTTRLTTQMIYAQGMYVVHKIGSRILFLSKDLQHWEEVELPALDANYQGWTGYRALAYGDGVFVLVGGLHACYSHDGRKWYHTFTPRDMTYVDCVYAPEHHMFVALGNGQYGSYSYDGIQWNEFSCVNGSWRGLNYNNGRFVAIAEGSYIAQWSENGTTWTSSIAIPEGSTTGYTWTDMAYGNGLYVAVAYNTNVYAYSHDGHRWLTSALPYSSYWSTICYANGVFVVLSRNLNYVLTSKDGIVWDANCMLSDNTSAAETYYIWDRVRYLNNRFVAIELKHNAIAVSSNGYDWCNYGSNQFPGPEYDFACFAYGGDTMVAIQAGRSHEVLYSKDEGWTWKRTSMPDYHITDVGDSDSISWKSVTYGDGKFVAVGTQSGAIRYAVSYDGAIWKWGPGLPMCWNWSAIGYSEKLHRWVALDNADNARGAWSDDGLTWNLVTTPSARNYRRIVYVNGMFVAQPEGSNGVICSIDGIRWVNVGLNSRDWRDITITDSGRAYISCSSAAVVAYSDYMTGWPEQSVPNSRSWWPIIHIPAADMGNKKGRTLMVSYNSNWVCYTDDETTWKEHSMVRSAYWTAMAYGTLPNGTHRISCLSTGQNYGIYSDDFGMTWTEFTMPTNSPIPAWRHMYYNNGKWFATEERTGQGYYATSNDGINWTINKMPLAFTYKDMVFADNYWYAVSYGPTGYLTRMNADFTNPKHYGMMNVRDIRTITYGNNGYVAAIYGQTYCLYSPDGYCWTEQKLPTARNWQCAGYINGKYNLVVYGANWFAYSSDGTTWAEKQFEYGADNTTQNWYWTCKDDKRLWVYADGAAYRAWTDDGLSWFGESYNKRGTQGLPINANWQGMDYCNGRYMAVGGNSAKKRFMAWSTDGEVWHESYLPREVNSYQVKMHPADNKHAVICNWGTRYACYTDDGGLTWKESNMRDSDSGWNMLNIGKDSNGVWRYISVIYNSSAAVYSIDYGHTWVAFTLPISAQWSSLQYDGPTNQKRFVMIAQSTTAGLYSNDGETWTRFDLPRSQTWNGLAYGDGKWVATAKSSQYGAISYDNGVTWKEIDLGDSLTHRGGLMYGNGTFVVTGYNEPYVTISKDGLTWQKQYLLDNMYAAADNPFEAAQVFDGTKFMVCNYGYARISTSLDGVVWKHYTNEQYIAHNENRTKFVAVLPNTNIAKISDDGFAWTSVELPVVDSWCSIDYYKGRYIAIAGNSMNYAISDNDGNSWKLYHFPHSGDWRHIRHGHNNWVVMPGDSPLGITEPMYSTNQGIEWQDGTIEYKEKVDKQWKNIAYGNGIYVAMARTTNICAVSTDGLKWKEYPLPSYFTCSSGVCFGNNKFVAITNTGCAIYSTDGIHWARVTVPSTAASIAWHYIGYLSNAQTGTAYYVAIPESSNLFLYSTDAITWTQGTLPSSGQWPYICKGKDASGKDMFVCVRYGSTQQLTSYDGVTWTASTRSERNWYGIAYGNGIWLNMVYSSNVVSTSSNGTTWTDVTATGLTSRNWYGVVYSEKYKKFVAFTHDTDYIAWSTNGTTWTEKQVLPEVKNWSRMTIQGDDIFITNYATAFYAARAKMSDLETWYSMALPQEHFKITSVAYHDNLSPRNGQLQGVFTAIQYSTKYAYYSHDDGKTWKSTEMTADTTWTVSIGTSRKIVAASWGGYSAWTVDGVKWISSTSLSDYNYRMIETDGRDTALIMSHDRYGYVTSNWGESWSGIGSLLSFTYLPSDWYYLIFTDRFITRSTLATAWGWNGSWQYNYITFYTTTTANGYRSMAYKNGVHIQVPNMHIQSGLAQAAVNYSEDGGETFIGSALYSVNNWYYAMAGKENFVVFSRYGRQYMVSPDGKHWYSGAIVDKPNYTLYDQNNNLITDITENINGLNLITNSSASSGGDMFKKYYDPSNRNEPLAFSSDIPTSLDQLSSDATHRCVTDANIAAWNGKAPRTKIIEFTLPVSNWSSNYQIINNNFFEKEGYVYTVSSNSSSFNVWAAACIYADDVTTNGKMGFHCLVTPTTNIVVRCTKEEVES